MRNKKIWLGILIMVLVFGMTVIGCDDGSTDDVSDLNGTWVCNDYGETTIKNGSYEFFHYGSGGVVEKGTYTVSDNIITFTQTYPTNTTYTAIYYPKEKKYVTGGTTYIRK